MAGGLQCSTDSRTVPANTVSTELRGFFGWAGHKMSRVATDTLYKPLFYRHHFANSGVRAVPRSR